MSTSKLKPFNDPRVTLRSAHLNGHTYGYIHANPTSTPRRGTIVLVHGFPDISFGWRYQIPFLASLGLEVIALDCLGYGRSDAPPSSHLSAYTCRRISNDIATLCQQLNLSSIILGGHDWGGMVVYRVALHHPTLIQAFFSICTPYTPPSPIHTPLQTVVQKSMPNFRYQIQFASGHVESAIQSPNEIRQFLNALYGGRTPEKKQAFSPEYGAFLDQVPTVSPSRLLSSDEMDYYVQEYARHGINGPLNWYRVREENYVEELESFFDNDPHSKKEGMRIVDKEVLFVQAMKDGALKPFMARKMDERIERLTWEKVDAGHWVLWEKPEVVNGFIGRWLEEKVFGKSEGGAKSKL